MSLQAILRDFVNQHGIDRTYCIGFSGGMDSHVLLSLCLSLQKESSLKLKVIHVHHGLSRNADAWEQHCQQVCHANQIDYVLEKINLNLAAGDSLEEQARAQRYAALSKHLSADDFLLTAHHQDDQAETLLIQLLRGAGPKGLAAMPVVKRFGMGYHGRPLLGVSRELLLQHAVDQQLRWIEDESNQNTEFIRNYVRHEIMPAIKKQFPGAVAAMARSAQHCAAVQDVADEYAEQLLLQVAGSQPNLLSVEKMVKLDANKQCMVLRAWVMRLGFKLPDTKKLDTILRDVLLAGWDKMPCVSWMGAQLRRYRDDLYLLKPKIEMCNTKAYSWDMQSDLEMTGLGTLKVAKSKGRGVSTELDMVTVGCREHAVKAGYAHRLKNLYQEHDVPPWERDSAPILYANNDIVSIVGYYINQKYLAGENQHGIIIDMA